MRWAWAIVIVFLILRLVVASSLNLAADEAYYWTWGQRPALGYFDHPPMIGWWTGLSTQLFGDTELAVRFLPWISFLLAIVPCWLISPKPLTLLLLATMPLFQASILATPDAPLILCWAWALWALHHQRFRLAGLWIGLAILSKLTALLLLPVLLFTAATRRQKLWAVGIALLVCSPHLWWLMENDWISWRFQLAHVAGKSSRILFALGQLAVVGPLLMVAVVAVLFRKQEHAHLWWAVSLPLGCALVVGGEANWAAPAYLSACILLSTQGGWLGRLTHLGVSLNLTLSALLVIHSIAPIIALPTDPLKRLTGGPELASAAMAWGEQEIWCSRYQEAALVWFYSGTATKVLINRDFPARSSQFELWDQSTPTAGLFIRPYRSSDYVELEPYGKEITDSGLVHHELFDGDARNWQIYQFTSKPVSQD